MKKENNQWNKGKKKEEEKKKLRQPSLSVEMKRNEKREETLIKPPGKYNREVKYTTGYWMWRQVG